MTNRMRHDLLLISRKNCYYHNKSSNINLSDKGWGDIYLSLSAPHKNLGGYSGLSVIPVILETETEGLWENLAS